MNKLLLASTAALGFLASNAAFSQDLVLETNVVGLVFVDDGFGFQALDGEENAETVVAGYAPSMALNYVGNIYRSAISAGAGYNWFINSDRDSVRNYDIGWLGARNTERTEITLNANFSERFIENVIELDGSGRSASETVSSTVFGVGFSRMVSERFSFVGGYGFLTNQSGGAVEEAFDDNEVHSIDIGIQRVMSLRSTIGLSYSDTEFRPDSRSGQAEASARGLFVDLTSQLGERWFFAGAIGAAQINFDDPPGSEVNRIVDDGDVTIEGQLSLSYQGLRDNLNFVVSSQTYQTLDGVVDEQEQASISWSRLLRENLSGSIQGRGFQAATNDRTFYSLNATLDWQPSLRWSYQLAYQYRQQEVGSIDIDGASTSLGVDSNRLSLRINYAFQDLVFDI